MTDRWQMFCAGLLGSAAVELVHAFKLQKQGKPMPAYYSKRGFWAVRLFIALLGGWLAGFGYSVQSEILAFQIGASTPLIVEGLTK